MKCLLFILLILFISFSVSAEENTIILKNSKINFISASESVDNSDADNNDNNSVNDETLSSDNLKTMNSLSEISIISFGVTGVFQSIGNLSKDAFIRKNNFDGTMSTDFEVQTHLYKESDFYIHFESGGGEGVNSEIPTITGINDDADNNETFRVTELWYEIKKFKNKVRFRLGKIDLTTDFDTNQVANTETDQFLSTGFVNNHAVEFSDDNGLGAMLWFSPTKKFNLGIGICDSDANWENVFDDLFSMLELDFILKPGGKSGNYRFYGWLNQKNHVKILAPFNNNENASGFGVSFDQKIIKNLEIFGRYGRCSEDIFQAPVCWSAGFHIPCDMIGRSNDVFGLAYGHAIIGKDWKKNTYINNKISEDENHLEVYYSYKLNEYLKVSPDIQWLRNPSGIETYKNFYVFGIRSQLYF